jgi:hypothetical protein
MIVDVPMLHVVEGVARRKRKREAFLVHDAVAVDIPSFELGDLPSADLDCRLRTFSSATEVRYAGWMHEGHVHLPVVPEGMSRLGVVDGRLEAVDTEGCSIAVITSQTSLVHGMFVGARVNGNSTMTTLEAADADFSKVLRSNRAQRTAEIEESARGSILVGGILHSRFVAPTLCTTYGAFHLADRRRAFDEDPLRGDASVHHLRHIADLEGCDWLQLVEDRSGFDLRSLPYPDREREMVLLARAMIPSLMLYPASEKPLMDLLDMESRLCEGSADRRDEPEFRAMLSSILPAMESALGREAALDNLYGRPVREFLVSFPTVDDPKASLPGR